MHSRTVAFLDDLAEVQWFSQVGKVMKPNDHIETIFVSNWDQAVAHCTSSASDDASVESLNQISMYLHQNHRDAYQLWNTKIAEMKPHIAYLLSNKKRNEAGNENGMPDDLIYKFSSSDMLRICIAFEYSDFYQSRYYSELAYWYLNGHFPCSWVGDVAEDFEDAFSLGKLVVF
ncbi:hypothetical protein F506_19070 [Herbaspirillum hiltneri N3]|uniref:Uncharacterized protein n=2 Tax=Herbaspirillum TaxID=963 RepID=A0ABN4HZY6_9BURK|nr:hypothetical protein F506_19070 [Herbaspirillum hiltneri N3]